MYRVSVVDGIDVYYFQSDFFWTDFVVVARGAVAHDSFPVNGIPNEDYYH